MSIRADGSIIIDTRINTEKASAQLLQLQNRIVKSADKINTLHQKMQQLKDAKVPTKEYEEISVQIKKAEEEFNKLLAKQEQMQASGKTSGAAWQSLQYKMEEIGNTIQYAKGELQDLLDTGQAFSRGADTSEYKELAKDLEYANADMKVLCRRHKELEDKQMKNIKGYSRMGQIAGSTSKKAGTFLKSLSSGFKGLNKHVKTGNGLFGQMGTRLKGLALSLLVFNWISKGWNAMISGMKEGIQNLAKHSDDFNQSMSELKSATEQAKNALATAFAPVISALIPYLVGLINIVNNACDAFARFWAYLSGKSTYTKAKKQSVDYAKSLDGIANSAKKALGALAGFDELNVISQNEDATGGSGDGSGGGNLFEEVPVGDVSDWLKKLKEAILAGDWYSVGEIIGQKLTEAMESINWDSVYAKAAAFGVGLALFLNGLISPELFGELGKTIAGAINTALHFLNSFGLTFDWNDFGTSLATGIDKFFETWDAGLTGETFSTFGKGILDSISAFISTLGEEDTFKDIAQKIVDFICGYDWASVLYSWGNFFEALSDAMLDFPTDFAMGIVEAIWEEISGQDVTLEKPKWLENIAELMLGWIIPPLGATNIAQKIMDAVMGNTGAHEAQSGKNYGGGGFQRGADNAKVLDDIKAKFNQFFEDIGSSATAFFDGLYAKKLQEFVKNTSTKFKEWWNNSVSPWFTKERWDELYENIKTTLSEKWKSVVSWWEQNGVSKWYNNNVKTWFTKEKWNFSGIKDGLSQAFKDAVASLKDIWNTFKKWIKDKLSFDLEVDWPDWGGGFKDGPKDTTDSVEASAARVNMQNYTEGVVIRGGSPFTATMGEQPAGQINTETRFGNMVEAFKQAYAEMGADMGGEYTFIAQLDGNVIFKETVRRNEMHKNRTGVSAYN